MIKMISVIGSSDCTEKEYKIAEQVGKEIALRKAVLVCGGLGGVMEAAAKGAKKAGGITVGIMPGNEKSNANRFIDLPVATGLGEARNIIVALSGDAVIAVGGGLGTLSELAFALKHKIPVIGIETWRLDKKYCPRVNIAFVSNAREAVERAFSVIG